MRVGVVGCGRMGRERAKAAASFGVNALFLFDEDSARMQALANECTGARTLNRSSDLFGEKLDAIFVCTPPFCKGPVESLAIDARVAFLVEKPIGVSAEQSRKIVEKLDQHNVLAAVGYMNRYRNSVAHARGVLESRNIIGITAHWVGRKYGVPWWAVRELSGGPFNEQATHVVDLFRYLTGEVEPIHAMARKSEGIETTVLALLRLRHGALASFLYSCEAKEKDIGISVETSDGVLELRGWDLDLVRNTIDGSLPEAESKPIFEAETHAFLTAVATGDRNLVRADYRDAHQTQIAMDGIAQMLKS